MVNSTVQFKWPRFIQSILDKCGLSYLWLQHFMLPKNISDKVKRNLVDQHVQNWHSQLQNSSKGINYSLFKGNIELENYILKLNGAL